MQKIQSLLLHQVDTLILYTVNFTAFYLPFLILTEYSKFEINLKAKNAEKKKQNPAK